MTGEQRLIIFASSLGAAFAWYDFYVCVTLATVLRTQFFSGVDPKAGFVFTLLALGAGFAVRPFGALVFGRIGDVAGRKHAFFITMTVMGLGTFLIGCLPSYASVGIAAPITLVLLRLVQGLALGGEYGGAATYVAEHAPPGRCGFYTSWIQTTATLGLLMAILVVIGIRAWQGEDAFTAWGWRIPLLLSAILIAISIWIRLQLDESPMFALMKAEGKASKAPLTEAFGTWSNAKIAVVALFGATAGEAVIGYGGQFFTLVFLTQTLKVNAITANILVASALALGTPFFVLFGWLSDRIGRKPIMLVGFLVGAWTYFIIFQGLTHYANPALENALASAPVTVIADPKECSFPFDPVGFSAFRTSCDVARSALAAQRVNYAYEEAPAGTVASVKVGGQTIASFDGGGLANADFAAKSAAFTTTLADVIARHGYPASADPRRINYPMTVLLLTILVIYVALVYGPIAAWLLELFPTRIRCSGMSLPYHIGNGWFGGFLPATSFAVVAATGSIYSGLWYQVIVAAMSFLVALIFLPETKDVDIANI